ncbi:MAG: AAA family ATPase [Armatimonadota bacterium]|nr:MAG: AAA family ATPase [Armatimonadota bacterium]
MKRHIVIVGAPGCGKTTVVRRTLERLRAAGVEVFGFWTGEIRERGSRQGFDIESLAGKRAVMAHVGLKGGPSVSKYRVDVEAIESVAVEEIRRALREGLPGGILVMDEIGKMELFCAEFRDAVVAAVDGPLRVLATAMGKPHPFVESITQRPDVEVVAVTAANRDGLPDVLIGKLAAAG